VRSGPSLILPHFARENTAGTRVAEWGDMNRALPHFLRFTRALALVSGVAVLPGCGGAVDTGPGNCDGNGNCKPYDGGPTDNDSGVIGGGVVGYYDGSVMGTAPYDGSATGTPPSPYDGGPTGTSVIDAGITAYDAGTYDGGPMGVPVEPPDAEALDSSDDDVFQGGGPLAPPDLPA
jgi:hypothetical protein